MNKIESEFKSALLEFNSQNAKNILQSGINNEDRNILIPYLFEKVLADIGKEWEEGELALSQIYMSGKICEEIIKDLFPDNPANQENKSNIAIITFNDYHILGKRIVISVLKSVGFNIIDFGHGINIDTLIEKIKKEKIKILLISVLMLPSALKIKVLRDKLNNQNIKIKILVGGAPFVFDELLWKQVGVDAMSKNPADAIKILNEWLTI